MLNDRWLKIIDEDGSKNVGEHINGFIYLEAKTSYPASVYDNLTVKGVDGELPSVATFAPFNLVIKFGLDGIDEQDINLIEMKIRRLFFKRNPYYIVTSDNPGIKYEVGNPDINPDYTDFSSARFEMTFSVFKGYSESLKDTSQFSLSSGDWQFEAGVLSDNEIKYKHTTTSFKIYNGSTDTINPLLRHKLKVLINLNAPKGFKIKNTTTGDVFEYKKAIKSNQCFTLDGVHPFINNKRVGIDTNWQWITLDAGFNDIEIIGENISNVQTQWVFPFIYR
ncbi:phage tail family protein [Staphylococcus aureus]|uniref:Phage tail family protein n=1 Tax=Staphylococcus aureus TaxID=1280 RepID=A0A7X3JUW7_STAAU|nr:phage tail family protein [Staphylococcus aureus]